MSDIRERVHACAAVVAAPVGRCLDLLADPRTLGRWALGAWGTVPVADDVWRGRSLFDDGEAFVKILRRDELGLVDYLVGGSADALAHRISARVHDGTGLGYGAGTSLVVLTAWRPAAMDDDRWHRLKVTHEAEILLLKGLMEGAAPAG
ncbi:MAG: hypothetical protein RLO50_05770 [Azospirillaceae bacterium]